MRLFFVARLGLLATAISSVSAQVATNFPDPNDDPFYKAPSNIASYAPGAVVRSRQVVTVVTGNFSESHQLFYRTNDANSNAIGTVATIWKPTFPASPPKVLSFQQAEDALNIDCAPSWAWVNKSSVQENYFTLTDFIIPFALNQGWYVVVSDNEGPNSAWITGLVEGRGSLDGIRSILNFHQLPASQSNVAIVGYSGGAHSSVGASSLAEQYAPELKLVGAAYGGTPIDLRATYELLNKSPQALLAGGAIIGLAQGHPDLNATVNSLLTPNGTATFAKLRGRNQCISAVGSQYAGTDFNSFFTSPPLQNAEVNKVVNDESLLSNVSSLPIPVPKFPRFEWHGTADVTVPYGPEAAYVQQQCAKGANIQFLTLPGLDHVTAFFGGLPSAILFVEQAMSGTLPTNPPPCGQNLTSYFKLGSSQSVQLFGSQLDNQLQQLQADGKVKFGA